MIVIVTVATPVALRVSVAVSVMRCVPAERPTVVNETPAPIWPSMLLVQTSDAPVSAPSSGSVPVPANVTLLPSVNVAFAAGAVTMADGGRFTMTVLVFELLPLGSVIVRLTVKVPELAYACVDVLPDAVPPSPNVQAYVGEGDADVEPLASKLQRVETQLDVKFAVGGGDVRKPV